MVPEYREHEQSVNTERQVAAREDEEVREAEKKRKRHLNPETRSLEQSVNTFRGATAREDEEVRERENEQRRNRRSVPVV